MTPSADRRLCPGTILRIALVFVSMTTCAVLPARAQENGGVPVPAAPHAGGTTLAALMARPDVMLVKDFYEVGRLTGNGRVSVNAVVVSLQGPQKHEARGLRIEIAETGRVERAEITYIDLDEVPALSEALHTMGGMAAKWKEVERPQYSEVQFSTRGALRLGFYQHRRQQGVFVSSGTAAPAHALLDMKDLARLKVLVDEGQRMLQGR